MLYPHLPRSTQNFPILSIQANVLLCRFKSSHKSIRAKSQVRVKHVFFNFSFFAWCFVWKWCSRIWRFYCGLYRTLEFFFVLSKFFISYFYRKNPTCYVLKHATAKNSSCKFPKNKSKFLPLVLHFSWPEFFYCPLRLFPVSGNWLWVFE